MELVGTVQLIAGGREAIAEIFELLREMGIKPNGNPDVYVREYDSFGVEEARELSLRAHSRALTDRRVFVLIASHITTEAQNALLKTLEEPAGGALFFIVVPSPHMLLPTFRSRAQFLTLGDREQKTLVDVIAFLKARPEARIDMLKLLLEKESDEKRDISRAIVFLSALETALSNDLSRNRHALEAVYRARKYIGDKGSLAKVLLEQVAFLT